MYILNIDNATKKMTANELRDFIFENYYKRLSFSKKNLFMNETLEKEGLQLFTTKLN